MARWFDKRLEVIKNEITKALEILENARNGLELLSDEQQEKMDNMPESLQESERYQLMESRLDWFDDKVSELDEFDIQGFLDSLDEIT